MNDFRQLHVSKWEARRASGSKEEEKRNTFFLATDSAGLRSSLFLSLSPLLSRSLFSFDSTHLLSPLGARASAPLDRGRAIDVSDSHGHGEKRKARWRGSARGTRGMRFFSSSESCGGNFLSNSLNHSLTFLRLRIAFLRIAFLGCPIDSWQSAPRQKRGRDERGKKERKPVLFWFRHFFFYKPGFFLLLLLPTPSSSRRRRCPR